MKNLKKLLVTLIMTAMICSSYTTAAFAESTEDMSGTQLQGTSTSVNTTGETAVDNTLQVGSADDLEADIEDSTEVAADDSDAADADIEDTEDSKEVAADDTEAEDDNTKEPSYTKSELRYLSCLIYAEAGNQSYSAMLGVANVVLNRVKSNVYWHVKTIKDVIYDDKWSVQFAVTIKNSKGISPLDRALKAYDTGKFSGNQEAEQKCMERAIKAAKAALNGKNNIGSYLCFSNKNYKSYVKKHYSKYKIIDDTIFFRSK